MTENDLQRLVTDAAELYGWSWAHFRPAQTARGWRTPVSGPIGQGFPDLILIRERDHRVLFLELKSDKGKLSTHQENVHHFLAAAGQAVHTIRPADFDYLLTVLQ